MGSKLCKGTLLFFVAGGHLVLWRHGFETSQGNTPLQILEPARLCQGCWQPDSGPFPVMLPNIAGRGPGCWRPDSGPFPVVLPHSRLRPACGLPITAWLCLRCKLEF
jgi:hypothetical protein